MATTGSTLKALRLKRGKTLGDIAKVTCIPKATVENLELDHASSLPAPVYVKGFIRLYCQALQVDPRDVVDLYEREQLARAQRAAHLDGSQASLSRQVLVHDRVPRRQGLASGVRVSHLVLLLFAALTFAVAVLTSSGAPKGTEVSAATPASSSAEPRGTVSSVAQSTLPK